jgi:hypothetical protein
MVQAREFLTDELITKIENTILEILLLIGKTICRMVSMEQSTK